MKRSSLIYALILGACISHPVLAHGQTTSPVGTWQVSILGSGKGTLMMTFSNNFTVTGYGISRKQLGFITLAGNWSINSKGDVVVAYIQTVNDLGTAFTLTVRMLSSGRFRARATSHGGGYTCKGEHIQSFSDLSGSWNAAVKRRGKTFNESFTAAVNSNYPSVFNVNGHGLSDTASYTLSGRMIISSHDAVGAVIDRTFGTDIQGSSLCGVFKSSRSKMRLQGTDETGAHISETAVR